MTRVLEEHHRQIRAGIAEIRQQCERASPDLSELAAARLRLSRASAARSKYVHDMLMPSLRQQAGIAQLADLNAMQRSFSGKRLISSQHVTRWTSKTIAEDWNGYRVAAKAIWAMMEEQIDRERRIFYGREPKSNN